MVENFLDGDSVLAGSYLPRQVSNHLSLAALHEGSSRAGVIHNLVTAYLADKDIGLMCEQIGNKVHLTWMMKRHNERPGRAKKFKTFTEYLDKNIRVRLAKRRIAEEHIIMILNRARDLDATDERPFIRTRKAERAS